MSKQNIITAAEARKKEIKDLLKELAEATKKMTTAKLEMTMGKLKDNTNAIMRLKKSVARIKTVLHEKQQLAQLSKKEVNK